MTIKIFIIVCCIILCILRTAYSIEYVVCSKDDGLCGHQCYSPESEDCHDNAYACPKNQVSCSGNCYVSGEKSCLNGSTVCENGQKVCGNRRICYWPETENCFDQGYLRNNEVVCNKENQDVCGYGCYNPTTHQCYNHRTLCEKDKSFCGFKCYDPASEECQNDITVCVKGQLACGSHVCYKPAEEVVCIDNKILCKRGEKRCGFDCYSEDAGESCQKGRKCAADNVLCGYECYNPAKETCFGNKKVCYAGREPCGSYYCYWRHNETCHERIGYSKFPCPNHLSPCGYECYNPLDQSCHNGNLCAVGDSYCAHMCYDRKATNLTCYGRSLCPNSETGCGDFCYNPNSETCHEAPDRCWDSGFC